MRTVRPGTLLVMIALLALAAPVARSAGSQGVYIAVFKGTPVVGTIAGSVHGMAPDIRRRAVLPRWQT